ncbi:hypothetical protein BH23ACT2_BH23ACT2_02210 [soil metagenome]
MVGAQDHRKPTQGLDHLGEGHGGIVTGSGGGAVLIGPFDPEGIEIRLYADPS